MPTPQPKPRSTKPSSDSPRHAEKYYRDADGNLLPSIENLKVAVGYVRRLIGTTPIAEFDPLSRIFH
ncbi:MAG: hypothetical protein JNK93_09435 [Planctomycetia bacterium]|nr:hypothetical protein [Planctomycetia bacterium]